MLSHTSLTLSSSFPTYSFVLFQSRENVSEYDIVKVLCAQSLWLLVLDSSAYTDADDENQSEEASSMILRVPRNVPLLYRPYTDDSEVDWEDRGSSNSSELLGIDVAQGVLHVILNVMLCVMLCVINYKWSH